MSRLPIALCSRRPKAMLVKIDSLKSTLFCSRIVMLFRIQLMLSDWIGVPSMCISPDVGR